MIEKLSFSKAGTKHENEDVVSLLRHPKEQEVVLCSLADGQGGQFGGGLAAKIAVEKSLDLASKYSQQQLAKKETWENIMTLTDISVCEHKDAGYTTIVSLCVSNNWVYGSSVGDSAAIVLSGDKKIILTENQRKNPPIGSSGAVTEFFSIKLIKPWKITIMSDGVWKYVGWDFIFKTILSQKGQNIIDTLFSSLMDYQRGYIPDDFSIALIQDLQ